MATDSRFLRMKRRVEKLEEKLKNESKVLRYKPRLSEIKMPASLWNAFYRLNEALEYAITCHERVFVFSVEPSELNCEINRMFVVASAEEFWHYYEQLKERHFYEVIGENTACHLYFDLEFMKNLNQGHNGYEATHLLLTIVFDLLKTVFNVECDFQHVLILDSSTNVKFSQHLVLHIPNAVFSNNFAAGHFVHHLSNFVLQNSDSKYKSLFVNVNEFGHKSLFVDQSVYSKNRNFRLYLSSKKSKNTILQRSNTCMFEVDCNVDTFESCCKFHQTKKSPNKCRKLQDDKKLIFYASLITNVHYNSNIKQIGLEKISIIKEKIERKIYPASPTKQSYLDFSFMANLKDFVLSQIPMNNDGKASVRQHTYFTSSQCILFDIKGNRFCHNVNRQHTSNNVFYLVELNNGFCYQMCHDPECRKSHFKQYIANIPKNILNNCDTNLNDEELLFYADVLSLP